MARQEQVYNARAEVEGNFAFSQAIMSDGTLYISGCLSWDKEGNPLAVGDMQGQVKNAYDDIAETLRENGLGFEHVVKETLFTTDMDKLVDAASVRQGYYKECAPPASTWIGIERLVHPDLMIEIEIVAKK